MHRSFPILVGLIWLTFGPNLDPLRAETNTVLPVVSLTASSHRDPNVPANTIDNNLRTRWSARGDGQWIRYDLGSAACIQEVAIAWHQGNSRTAAFDIEISMDVSDWTKVLSGQSSGQTLGFEGYGFNATAARYMRIVGHGNSRNRWNAINEVEMRGSTCQQGGGTLVWQDQFDLEQDFDIPEALVVADHRVYVVSVSETASAVRALSLDSGALLWQKPLRQDIDINATGVQDGRLFVAGSIVLPDIDGRSQKDVFVRAFDASTGKRLWTHRFDFDNEPDHSTFSEEVKALAVADNRVFVGGSGAFKWTYIDEEEGPILEESDAFLVLALDASTGDLLWRHELSQDGANGLVTKILVQGEQVLVAGDFAESGIVRALSASTGQLLWEDQVSDADTVALAADQDRAYVALHRFVEDGERGMVRALNVQNGTLLWEDQIPGDTRPSTLTVGISGVFVGGFRVTDANIDAYIRALDAELGSFLWERQFDLDGGRDFVHDIATADGVVMIAGSSDVDGTLEDAMVRALDAVTGETLWVNQFDLLGSADDLRLVTLVGDKVITAGYSAVARNADGSVNFSDFDAVTRVLNLGTCPGCQPVSRRAAGWDDSRQVPSERLGE